MTVCGGLGGEELDRGAGREVEEIGELILVEAKGGYEDEPHSILLHLLQDLQQQGMGGKV